MNSTTGRLTVTRPPKFWKNYEWTCRRCGAETLKRPVFLSDGGHYGPGCAAELLGIPRAQAARVQKISDRQYSEAEAQAAIDAERAARYAAALADFEARGREIINDGTADFNVLRWQHEQRDPSLRMPRAFAEWLRGQIAELSA